MEEAKKETELEFLNEVAGQGYENVSGEDVTVPLLLIAQALSGVVEAGTVQAGHFYNSVTGEDYGTELDLVICHYVRKWYVWLPEQKGLKGIYDVNSFSVSGDPYTGMTDAEGNKVEEKMVFMVVLPEHPEAGYMVFGSTPGNMKYTKAWLTQARNLRLPSGAAAPLFGGVWHVKIGKAQSKRTSNKYFACCTEDGKSSFTFKGWIPQVLYNDSVLPAREMASSALQLADYKAEQLSIEHTVTDEETNF